MIPYKKNSTSTHAFLIKQHKLLNPVKPKRLLNSHLKQPLSVSYNDNDLFKPKLPNIDFDDVGGSKEIIESLGDFVRYLQNPTAYQKMGVNMPKGIILSGAPGVGKTFMAEAIAGQAGVPFFQISASSMQDSLVGGTEKILRKLFETVRKAAPCVLCIDEIDSLGQKRFEAPKHGSEQNANSIVNQLLTLLAEDNGDVIIIATTNNFETLDPALVRPGRFDRHITVPKPDVTARQQILALHAKNKYLDSSVSLEDLAKQCEGYSGAELATLINEAALNAARSKSNTISFEDFEQARSMVKEGVKGHQISDPKQKERTAIHEAAHALVGHLLNRTLHKVSILQYGTKLGVTENIPYSSTNLTKQEMLDEICISLAGRAGEILTDNVQCGNTSDLNKAKGLAYKMIHEGMVGGLLGESLDNNAGMVLQKQLQRACKLLENNRSDWDLIIRTLIKYDVLTQKDFITLMEKKNNDCFEHSFHHEKECAMLPIPPSKKNCIKLQGNLNNSETKPTKSLPFSLEMVAKAIEVDACRIRKLYTRSENLIIQFKPSFTEHQKMEGISNMLKKYDVDNTYVGADPAYLCIYNDGMDDFKKYVGHKMSDDSNKNKDFGSPEPEVAHYHSSHPRA